MKDHFGTRNGLAILCALMLAADLCRGEVIKPEKVSASSELTRFKGHLATFAADGKVDGEEYWCSDFDNKVKPPHWIEFDFGTPKKFNQIQLFMCEKNNLTMLFNDFRIEYWGEGGWRTVVDKKDYLTKYLAVVNGSNAIDKYAVEIPDPYPVFRFEPVTSSKVRLLVEKLPDSNARLREMVVSMAESDSIGGSGKTATATEYPGVFRFDFGPAKVSPMPGFTKISADTTYDAQKGYGWLPGAAMTDCDRRFPGVLRRDFVASAKADSASTFKLKTAPGRYYVYVLCGDAIIPSPGCHLVVNGREYEVPANDKGDFWPECFVGEARNDGLNITVKGGGVINAMIVAPVKQWRDLQEICGGIAVDPGYTGSKNSFTKEGQSTHHDKSALGSGDGEQGYLCYVTSPQLRIFPETTPCPEQVKDMIEAAATPDEFETACFAVYGMKDVADLKVTLNDLKSSSGDVFPARNIDLRVVRCWPQRSGHKGSAKTWSVVPELLEPFTPQDIPAETSRQFWLTFHVPEKASPGLYKGDIDLKANNLPDKKMQIEFQVYPFTLKETGEEFFAMYHGGRAPFCTDPNPKLREQDMLQLRDMRQHGMNSVILSFSSSWLSFPEVAEKLTYCNRLLDEVGFPKRPIPLHHEGMTPELAAQIRDLVKKENLREILFYPVDEPFNKKLDRAVKMYKEIKKVPGIRTYSTVTQNDVDTLGDDLDVRTYTITDYAKFEPDRIREECRNGGKSFWWYSNAAREYPDAVRFKAGYFYWKTGAKGQAYWAYANYQDDAFNDFDKGGNDHCVVHFKGGKLYSTIQWEAIREGLDDFKYIHTLEELIRKNGAEKPEACAKAQRLLDEIKADTVVDLKEYKKHFGEEIAVHIKSFWPPERYDLYRQKIAERIIGLSGK